MLWKYIPATLLNNICTPQCSQTLPSPFEATYCAFRYSRCNQPYTWKLLSLSECIQHSTKHGQKDNEMLVILRYWLRSPTVHWNGHNILLMVSNSSTVRDFNYCIKQMKSFVIQKHNMIYNIIWQILSITVTLYISIQLIKQQMVLKYCQIYIYRSLFSIERCA